MRLIDAEPVIEKLKELRKWADSHRRDLDLLNLQQILEAAPVIDLPPNDPLTMEELQEMDGESVWVDSFVKGVPSFYAVVHGKLLTGFAAGSDRIINMSPDHKGAYGLAWLAYRRKPDDTDN